jgi:hypothetical protein
MKNHLLLRIVATVICLYSVGLGVCMNGPASLVGALTTSFLDYPLPKDSTLLFAARMIGVYMGFFGVTMGLVAWNPVRHRSLLTAATILLVLRVIQRLAHLDELQVAFGLSAQKNASYVATLVTFAVILLAFRIGLHRELKTAPPGAAA